jgi:hypothetical protein
MSVAGKPGVKWFKALRGTAQEFGGSRAAPLVEGDSAAQLLGQSAAQFGWRIRLQS